MATHPPPVQPNEQPQSGFSGVVILLMFLMCSGVVASGSHNYWDLTISCLVLTLLAAVVQFFLAFSAASALLPLGHALLLSTVVTPLIIARQSLSVEVGTMLWVVNLVYVLVLISRWVMKPNEELAGWVALTGTLGTLLFGLHIVLFSSSP